MRSLPRDILTPIAWPNEGKDFVVKTGPFAKALKETLASLPDQPYYNSAYVDYQLPSVNGIEVKDQDGGTQVAWSPRLWPDLRWTWKDWSEFDHFEVRDATGKVLASTTDTQAQLPGRPSGLTLTAVKQASKPNLPAITGLKNYEGRLRWDEIYDYYCDHYRVEVFANQDAQEPLQKLTVRQAAVLIDAVGTHGDVWCRVMPGANGPWSPRVHVVVPYPGKRLLELGSLQPVVVNSPDMRWKGDATVGGQTQPGLFQHPPPRVNEWAGAEYRLRLPKAKPGQRLFP